jgi:hypothetical protein
MRFIRAKPTMMPPPGRHRASAQTCPCAPAYQWNAVLMRDLRNRDDIFRERGKTTRSDAPVDPAVVFVVREVPPVEVAPAQPGRQLSLASLGTSL